MADSQTDRPTGLDGVKATNWSITAWNAERDMLESIRIGEDKFTLPFWVRELAGGLEKCKKTGTIHFQGHLFCRGQQRGSTVKRFLPTAHLTVDRNRFAAKQYVMKADTAAGDKTKVENNLEYVDNEGVLRLLANTAPMDHWAMEADPQEDKCLVKFDFWKRVNKIIETKPYLIGLLCKPDTWRAWNHTYMTWFRLEKHLPNYSITQIASEASVPSSGGCHPQDGKPRNEVIISPESITNGPFSPPPCVQEEGNVVCSGFIGRNSGWTLYEEASPSSQEDGSSHAPASRPPRPPQGSPDCPGDARTGDAVELSGDEPSCSYGSGSGSETDWSESELESVQWSTSSGR